MIIVFFAGTSIKRKERGMKRLLFVMVAVLGLCWQAETFAYTVSHGRQVLLNRGIQIQSLVYYGSSPLTDLTLWQSANFTTINSLQLPQTDTLAQLPGTVQWGRWFQVGNEGSRDLRTYEYPYESQLASIQYGDEEKDVMTQSRLDDMKTTYDHWRLYWPNTLVHSNFYGSQYTADQLKTYMQATEPDMLMFDSYPAYSGSSMESQKLVWYSYMQKYRTIALAGYDNTGTSPIAYAQYLNLFRNSYSNPTPSESFIRLQQFASWAFGFSMVTAYLYNDPGVSGVTDLCPVMFNSIGDTDPNTTVFNDVAETNRQSRNLGPALVRLVSTDIRMIPGTGHSLPSNVSQWVSGHSYGDPTGNNGGEDYITSITPTVSQGGVASTSYNDVLVGYFKPLLTDNSSYPFAYGLHFMIVNGANTGTAEESGQWYHIIFDLTGTNYNSLRRLNRDTGKVEVVALTDEGNSQYSLDLYLPGGTGDLFGFWNDQPSDTVHLYLPNDASWQFVGVGVARQVFTVPEGYVCTKFEFGASEGSQVGNDLIYVQLFNSPTNTTPMYTGFAKATDVGGSNGWGWIAVDGLELPAGVYSAQLYTNSSNSNIVNSLYVLKSPNHTYPGAYASTSWQDDASEEVIAGEFWTRMSLREADSDASSVKNLYDPNAFAWYFIGGNAARQSFTVPSDSACMKFEIALSLGSQTGGTPIYARIYDSLESTTPLYTEFLAVNDIGGFGWLPIAGMRLSPGTYYVEVFTEDISNIRDSLYTAVSQPYSYTGAYAASNWQGEAESPLSPAGEFWTRITLLCEGARGDFNNDGKVNATDIDLLSAAIKTPNPDSKFDLTGEGLVNSVDMDVLVKDILKTYYGDADLNRSVGVSDLSVLAAYYNTASGASWANGDFDGNGAVGVSDLSILAANYNSGSASTVSWAEAYAQAFGTTSDAETSSDEATADEEDTGSTICSSLGLSLIAGLALMGLMIVKMEE
jgi:hypothetical protein